MRPQEADLGTQSQAIEVLEQSEPNLPVSENSTSQLQQMSGFFCKR
jgi:hypothetical protein